MKKKYISHVAGVTFPNEEIDGGDDRQALLKWASESCKFQILTLEHTTWHNPVENTDEDAIKVHMGNSINSTVIGWIPRADLGKFKHKNKAAGEIVFIKDKYCCLIHDHKKPTAQQYAAAIKMGKDVRKLPYTAIAYPNIKIKAKVKE